MQRTIDFAVEANPHIANFNGCLPLPGTEFYDIVKKEGKFTKQVVDGIETGYQGGEYSYEIGDVNQELINKYLKKAFKEFYFRPAKIAEMAWISLQSVGELKWTVEAILPILKNFFLKEK